METERSEIDASFEEGDTWLHIYVQPMGGVERVVVAFAWEHVGIEEVKGDGIMMSPADARQLVALIGKLPGVVRDDTGISLPLNRGWVENGG